METPWRCSYLSLSKLQNRQLSISIVCYYPSNFELDTAIDSLITAIRRSTIESSSITLIDNSETNELDLAQFARFSESLQSTNCELRLVQGQGNVGYGAGHNLVIAKSNATFSLLMNTDIQVDIDALLEGFNYLEANSDVGAVSPSATFDSGDKQYLCKRLPTVFDFFLRGFMPGFVKNLFSKRLANFEMRELSETEPTKDIPIISGCFMLCRTEALQRVAGFNEEYFLYFEDFDLSMRLNEQYSLAYLPDMKITHHGGHSARKGFKHIKLFVQSANRFFNTYGWRII